MNFKQEKVQTLAFWSIIIAGVVFSIKIMAWLITGSVALYSEALESIINLATATITFWTIRISFKPADCDHQYGHHKAEYFAAMLQGVLICLVSAFVLRGVWNSWTASTELNQPLAGLLLTAIAACINTIWMAIIITASTKEKSPALLAEGKHIISDVMTSLVVLVGISGIVMTKWHWIDPLLAFAIALTILKQGLFIIYSSIGGLMDQAAKLTDIESIRNIIRTNMQGAMEIHALRTRIAGRATFIEFNLIVEDQMSVGSSHAICDRIEEALKTRIPNAQIIIHVEPRSQHSSIVDILSGIPRD